MPSARLPLILAAVIGCVAGLLGGPAPSPPADLLVLEGPTVLDMTGAPPRPATSILIRDGRVADLYPTGSAPPPPGARVLELRGRHAIPGLIDSHVHLTSPTVESSRQDSLARFLLLGGVTAIRDMAGDGVVLRDRALAARAGSTPSPRIFFSTVVAGPEFFARDSRAPEIAHGGTLGRLPWMRGVSTEEDAVAAAAGAKEFGSTGIKAYAELSPGLLRSVSREAHARGLKVWSHASVVPAKPSDAVAAGVDVLSHAHMLALESMESLPQTYSAALGLRAHDRPPTTSTLGRLFEEMRGRGTRLDATLFIARRLAQGRRAQEGDLSNLRGVDAWAIAAARLAHQAGVRFVAGTDVSGTPGQDERPTLHEELAIYVEEVGMTPAEALATATRNAAQMLGAQGDLGTIAPGTLADLLILEADPLADIRNTRRIACVIKGGFVHEVGGPDSREGLDWQPSWPGTQFALVRGTPSAKGPFVFRFRMPDGYWAHPHRHPVDARIRVLSGTYLAGFGAVLDPASAEAIPAGGEILFEAERIHSDGARGETVIEVSGEGPWGVTFLDPEKDPAAAKRPR